MNIRKEPHFAQCHAIITHIQDTYKNSGKSKVFLHYPSVNSRLTSSETVQLNARTMASQKQMAKKIAQLTKVGDVAMDLLNRFLSSYMTQLQTIHLMHLLYYRDITNRLGCTPVKHSL